MLLDYMGEFDRNDVRVTEDGRFSVYDVLVAFGVCDKSHSQETLKRIESKYPEVMNSIDYFQFSGRGQRLTPVANEETLDFLLSLTNKHPLKKVVTSDKFFPRTEDQIVSVLSEAFSDCEPCPQFYCFGYRIDLYLAKPRIAIECDENGHKCYGFSKESVREQKIKDALGCSFVRFNPYDADFNLGVVIRRIRDLV